MDIELRHCRALLALAEHRGIARAARALGLAQSTFSETLFSLERVAGFAVTTRAPGLGATLTPQAEALLPHARRLIQVAEETLAFARGAQPHASFTIGATESIGTYVLPGVLGRVREAWPATSIHVRTGLCAELRQLVSARQLEVALTVAPGIDEVLPAEQTLIRLAGSRISLFRARGSAAGALGRGQPAPTICVPDPEGSFNTLLSAWLRTQGIAASLRSAGSVEAVKHSVAAGLGLGALPLYAIGAELERGECIEVATPQPLPPLVMEAALLAGTERSGPLATLLDALASVTLRAAPRRIRSGEHPA